MENLPVYRALGRVTLSNGEIEVAVGRVALSNGEIEVAVFPCVPATFMFFS